MNSLLDRSIASEENVFGSDDLALMSENSYESVHERSPQPALRTSFRLRRSALMELVGESPEDDEFPRLEKLAVANVKNFPILHTVIMRNFSAIVYLAAMVKAYNRAGKRKELTTKLLHAHFVVAALSEDVVPVDGITTDAEIAARAPGWHRDEIQTTRQGYFPSLAVLSVLEERDIYASRFKDILRQMRSTTRSIATMKARAIESAAVTETMEVHALAALDQAKREIRTEIQEGRRVEMEARMALTRTTLAKTHNIEIMVVVLVGLMVVTGAAILVAKLA